MAIFHAHAKVFSRANGVSILARAAYRSGGNLTSNETGLSFDFSRKGGVVFSNILLPDNAPKDYLDRETLWNAVEAVETQSNAQLAREFECAIPREIPESERERFVTNFIQNTFVNYGMCADYSIHNPSKKEPNPHVHILLTMRPIKENGEWGDKFKNGYLLDEKGNKIPELDEKGKQKIGARGRKMWKRAKIASTNWNDVETLNSWRKSWEIACNSRLSKEKHISCESNSSRGIDLLPTKHEGVEGVIRHKIASTTLDRNVVRLNKYIKHYNKLFSHQTELILLEGEPSPFVECYPTKYEEIYPYEFCQRDYGGFVRRNSEKMFKEQVFQLPECNLVENKFRNSMSLHVFENDNVNGKTRSGNCGAIGRTLYQLSSTSRHSHGEGRTLNSLNAFKIRIPTVQLRTLQRLTCSSVQFPNIPLRTLQQLTCFNVSFPTVRLRTLQRQSRFSNPLTTVQGRTLQRLTYSRVPFPIVQLRTLQRQSNFNLSFNDNMIVSEMNIQAGDKKYKEKKYIDSSKTVKIYRYSFGDGDTCYATASEIREAVNYGFINEEEFKNVLTPKDYYEIFPSKEQKKVSRDFITNKR